MKTIHKHHIKWRNTEPYTPQHNKTEDAIRELKKRTKVRKVQINIPGQLWDFHYKYKSEILGMMPWGYEQYIPCERTKRETIDISEYTTFMFYETMWFWDHPADEIDNPQLGK